MLFDNNYELLHDRIDIRAVNPITEKEYQAGGSTALLDAIGRTIHKIVNAQKHTTEDYRAEKVMFVIITDGEVIVMAIISCPECKTKYQTVWKSAHIVDYHVAFFTCRMLSIQVQNEHQFRALRASVPERCARGFYHGTMNAYTQRRVNTFKGGHKYDQVPGDPQDIQPGKSQRSIALSCECSRNTVVKVIASAKPTGR